MGRRGLFSTFDTPTQEACRQVFLRLVELGEGTEDTRRRITRSELDALEVDRDAIGLVIESFGQHRLLAFDRDAATREPTVELAHESLIRVWRRLRDWVDASRDDLRMLRRLVTSADEWLSVDREPSFLLGGERLERIVSWAAQTDLPRPEGTRLRRTKRRATPAGSMPSARAERERSLERRSVQRLRALVAVLASAALVAAGLTLVAADRSREAGRLRDGRRWPRSPKPRFLGSSTPTPVSCWFFMRSTSPARWMSRSRGNRRDLHWAMQKSASLSGKRADGRSGRAGREPGHLRAFDLTTGRPGSGARDCAALAGRLPAIRSNDVSAAPSDSRTR